MEALYLQQKKLPMHLSPRCGVTSLLRLMNQQFAVIQIKAPEQFGPSKISYVAPLSEDIDLK
jgi:hypothetical protein